MKNKITKGFTLIELLVVISIIAILMSIMMPALRQARRQGQAVVCKANLRQWGLSFSMYTPDYENELPVPYTSQGWGSGYSAPQGAWYQWSTMGSYMPSKSNVNNAQNQISGGIAVCPTHTSGMKVEYGRSYSYNYGIDIRKFRAGTKENDLRFHSYSREKYPGRRVVLTEGYYNRPTWDGANRREEDGTVAYFVARQYDINYSRHGKPDPSFDVANAAGTNIDTGSAHILFADWRVEEKDNSQVRDENEVLLCQ